jgi:hypothetical protein
MSTGYSRLRSEPRLYVTASSARKRFGERQDLLLRSSEEHSHGDLDPGGWVFD